jgi:YesN/AraC family two-component response regulator
MTMRALIVEDEAVTARDLADILSHLGYIPCGTAADYADAIAILEREQPDIALLDIGLRGERDGLAVARYIRATRAIPIVFLTSRSDAAAVAEARALRANGYIVKPFQDDMVFATIETAFGNFLEDSAALGPGGAVISKGGLAGHVRLKLEAYIASNYHAAIRLDQLADLAGLSRFHFAAAFKQTFGEPPHRYLMLARVKAAKSLLIGTDQPIIDVAQAVGYESHAHFSAVFKRETGISPLAFRRQYGASAK